MKRLLFTLALLAVCGDVCAQGFPGISQSQQSIRPRTVIWDSNTTAGAIISSGGLVATNTGVGGSEQGARSTPTMYSGSGSSIVKFVYEIKIQTTPGGGNWGFGVGGWGARSTYTNLGNTATSGCVLYAGSGNIWGEGGNSGKTFGAAAIIAGTIWQVAYTYNTGSASNRLCWFRRVHPTISGWNNNASDNPATGSGGITLTAGATPYIPPYLPTIIMGGASAGTQVIANFGEWYFTAPAPQGFYPGVTQ